jgi:hypothetical protein
MKNRLKPSGSILILLSLGSLWLGAGIATAESPEKQGRPLRDLLWVWGNPDMAKPGEHTFATFAQASSAQRAKLLGVPNIVMAGLGIPNDQAQAEALTREVASSPRLVWEIGADGEGGPPFVYTQRLSQVRRLVDQFPRIEAVLLDDMSTVSIDKGFKPENIRQIRRSLDGKYAAVKLWGVLYTMSFNRPKIDEYINELDVINLWTWHAKDVVKLEQNVAHCEKKYPGKPIMLGLYLYDYGDNRRMSLDLLKRQCDTALELVHAGRIQGIVFLTIDSDVQTLSWAADWIKRVGDQKIALPAAGRKTSAAPVNGKTRSTPVKTVAYTANADQPATRLTIGDGKGWHFSGGPWAESAEGVITPPNQRNLHSRAFSTTQGFADFTAEFDFNGSYRETGSGGAGLAFRATDSNHFYAVYCPWGGQQLRAKHFWVTLSKSDGDGYLRHLKSVYVPGVPSETDRWYRMRLEAKGPEMTVWIDGRRALSIRDDSYRNGAVGMMGYGWYSFRNVNLAGKSEPLTAWDRNQPAPVNHFQVGLDSSEMPSGCLAPNGDVLVAANSKLVRSKDKGRTWGAPESLPGKLGKITDYGNSMFRTAKGRLIVQLYSDDRAQTKTPTAAISISESADNGRTWSDPAPAKVAEGWPAIPEKLIAYGSLVETEDGTLLRFLYGAAKEPSQFANVATWGSVHCKAYAIRSTDGGRSWSAPIELDRPGWYQTQRGAIPGSLDLTEPTGVAIGNKVMVVIRPIYSETMWQCWSDDAGAAWDGAARTTFPGYAQSMVRLKSGVIAVTHRYPHYSIHLSRDNGLNWDEGTTIDYPFWAMGCTVEVEPNVLLCTYMNAERNMPLLAQLVRVTPEGVEPVRR